jgi:DNA-binding XRE family transcriptional regulator
MPGMVPVKSPEYQRMLARLKQARLGAGLTQVEVAERLGVRQTVISKVELGERRVDPVNWQFAEIYGLGLSWPATNVNGRVRQISPAPCPVTDKSRTLSCPGSAGIWSPGDSDTSSPFQS